LFAWLAWLFIHLIYLVEFENRLLIVTQWAWNYFTRNRSARLITGESPSSTQNHNRCAPSSLLSSRSNVPSGKWPAFRATSNIKQSENPSLGRFRKCTSAAATPSASCSERSL
jgi:hypothetical protein